MSKNITFAGNLLIASGSHRQFLDNWGDLERYCGYREDNIPQLEDINRHISKSANQHISTSVHQHISTNSTSAHQHISKNSHFGYNRRPQHRGSKRLSQKDKLACGVEVKPKLVDLPKGLQIQPIKHWFFCSFARHHYIVDMIQYKERRMICQSRTKYAYARKLPNQWREKGGSAVRAMWWTKLP